MAKPNLKEGKYKHVEKLPSSALTVNEYANQEGISVPHVYKRYRLGQGGFEIVVFKTMNFVLPKNK